MKRWSIGDETIEVCDITQRVEDLREQFGIEDDDSAAREEMRRRISEDDDEEWEELNLLEKALSELASSFGDFKWEGNHYPNTLIHSDYFTDYAKQVAEDTGAVSDTYDWPNNHIDWDAAADELMGDYTPVEIDGNTYYYR